MYKKGPTGWMKHWDFTLLDILILQFAYTIAYMLRHGLILPYSHQAYQRMAVIMVLIDLVIVFFTEAYNGIIHRTLGQELKQCVVNGTEIFMGMNLYLIATKQVEIFSRTVLFLFWGLLIILLWISRTLLKHVIRKRLRSTKRQSEMIVVTMDEYAEEILKEFRREPYREFNIQGVVIIDRPRKGETICGTQVVANADDFFDYVKRNVVDEVFVNGNTRESTEAFTQELLEMGITVHYNLVNQRKLVSDRMVQRCGSFLVLTASMHIASPSKLFLKRAMDIAGSLVGLLITGVAYMIVAPVIRKQAPGPIFFSQERVGQNGRRFKLYKFRSMYVDAEARKAELMEQNEMDGLMFKMKDDPRIFPFGKVMRKYSIDELPQFWNVLKGDMSLVGTRPPTVDEFEQYDVHHKARLGYKPGITGLWQVSGRSDITDFEEVVRLDTSYITEWSLGLDFAILVKTIQVVISGKGSE